MKQPVEPSSITWKTPGVIGYSAIALVLIGTIITVRLLIPAAEAATVSDEVARADAFTLEQQRATFSSDMDQWVSTINGRSPFFVPVEPIKEEVVEKEPDPGDGEKKPVKPRRYAGPGIIAAMNGRIWLKDDSIITIGEEASGVTLVHMDNVPWSVRVEWQGVEFDVDIFENTTARFLTPDRDGE